MTFREIENEISTSPLRISSTSTGWSRLWSLREVGNGQLVFSGRQFTGLIICSFVASPFGYWLANQLDLPAAIVWSLTFAPLLVAGSFFVGRIAESFLAPTIRIDRRTKAIRIDDEKPHPMGVVLAVQILEFEQGTHQHPLLVYQWNLVYRTEDSLKRVALCQSSQVSLILHDAQRMSEQLDVPLMASLLPGDTVGQSSRSAMLLLLVFPLFGSVILAFQFSIIWNWIQNKEDVDWLFWLAFIIPVSFITLPIMVIWLERRTQRLRETLKDNPQR